MVIALCVEVVVNDDCRIMFWPKPNGGDWNPMASPGDVSALLQNLTDATQAFTSFAEEVKIENTEQEESLSEEAAKEAVEERKMPDRRVLRKKDP